MNSTTKPFRNTLTTTQAIMAVGKHGIIVVKENVVGGKMLLQTRDISEAEDCIQQYNDEAYMANVMLDEEWTEHRDMISLLIDMHPLPWSISDKDGTVIVTTLSGQDVILPMHEFSVDSAVELIAVASELYASAS